MAQTSEPTAAARGAVPVGRSVPIVLGSGITALGVVRNLGRAGLEPVLACRPGDLAGRSRAVRGRVVHLVEDEDPAALVAGLERHGLHEGVVLGCSDIWSTALSRLPEELRSRYRTSMPSAGVLDLLVDKWLFAQALVEHDVPHPRTIAVGAESDLDDPAIETPFLKPRHSQQFARVFDRKAFSYSTPEEGQAAFRAMRDARLDAVLQDYIPGPPTEHVFIDGFIDRTGVMRAVLARRRLRMFPPDFGNSTLMVSIAPETAADAIQGVERLLTGIGYRGIFSAELKLDPRDGLHKLLEVNSRPWWYIGFAAYCGMDVAPMAYRDALDLPVADNPGYRVGARCVLLRQDARAYLRLRREGRLGFVPWVRSWLGATGTIFAWDDPLPAVVAPRQLLALRERRRRRRRG